MSEFDFNAELADSVPSAKFDHIGDTYTGRIIAADIRQAIDYESGKPDYWNSGEPKKQIRIELDTGGQNRIAVWIKLWGSQKTALKTALRRCGTDANTALAPGNMFTATFVREVPSEKNPRLQPAKEFEYRIDVRANLDSAGLDETPTPTEPVAPAGQGYDIPALIRAGLDNASIAKTTGMQPSAIQTIRDNITN
ncbi:hypothetical protein [Trueperella sp. LYQ143]|uniref:hypothetical protein n=1 Tax=unclassified Trueperella TaxID=2630174 RepID=UPI003983B0D4